METVPYYLFEDPGWRRFGPMTTLRPVWDIRLAGEKIHERISRQMDKIPAGFYPRETLQRIVRDEHGNDALKLPTRGEIFLVNARSWKAPPVEGIKKRHPWAVWTDGPDVVAARLPVSIAAKWLSQPVDDPDNFSVRKLLAIWSLEKNTPAVQVNDYGESLFYWPWELLKLQEEAIADSFTKQGLGEIAGEVHYRTTLVEEDNIVISAGANISPGVVLDASAGSIVIDENVRIMPNAVIIGPVYIGKDSVIKPGAKLFGPLSVGPVCKLGGEVEESIIQGYSNKQHEGFLGHALVGEWVNLGADTNNSDLKNNYSSISIVLDGENIDTGEQFFGGILGDHVKTGINTMLNTGTVIGVGSNIFGSDFPPKHIEPFSWGSAAGMKIYEFDRFIHTARTVMARRNIPLTPAMAALLRLVHADSTRSSG
ncbi:hypothetical protein K8I28_04300 [bacterium]|nr:hypothetical protein [bacterium]